MAASQHLLIRAARGEEVERVPVWAMRQAGRWDPEYHRVRQGLGFYEFSERVDLAIEASLLPRRFGVDAIILFYDITTLPVAMGLPFRLLNEIGPMPDSPVRTMADVDALDPNPAPNTYQHILDLLEGVRVRLAGSLPILVFAGAPFTVASYCIGTGKNIEATRRFATEHPETWNALLNKLGKATGNFINTLVDGGADGWQLFDSWAGKLTPQEYDTWAHPWHQSIIADVPGIPGILFVKECPYLDRVCTAGAPIVSLGAQHDLAQARRDYPHLVFQGNVPESIVRSGTVAEVEAATRACLQAGGGRRHILNLSHGVDRRTPVDNMKAYLRAAGAHGIELG
jgi:uroporphyrinogen decarboxylase